MALGPSVGDGKPAVSEAQEPGHGLVVVIADVADHVDVYAAELPRIGRRVDRVHVAVVQFGGMGEEERLGIPGTHVLQQQRVLGVVLDVAPVRPALAVPVAVVEHPVVALPLARLRIGLQVPIDRLFVNLEPLRVARGDVVKRPAAAVHLGRRGGQQRTLEQRTDRRLLRGRRQREQQLVRLGHPLLQAIAAGEQVVVEVMPFFLEGELVVACHRETPGRGRSPPHPR